MTWDAWKDKAWSAGASFVLTSAKKVETQAWRTFEPVGQWTNKTAGRFGLESFYPTTLDKEVDKCARIIRTFTEPAKDEHGNEIQADFHDGDVVDEYADRKKQSVLYKIPPKILQSARGVAVFTVFRYVVQLTQIWPWFFRCRRLWCCPYQRRERRVGRSVRHFGSHGRLGPDGRRRVRGRANNSIYE